MSCEYCINMDMDSLDVLYLSYFGKNPEQDTLTYDKLFPRALELFKKEKVKCTFFVIGSDIKTRNHKELLCQAVNEGHEIANHTYNHPLNFSQMTWAERYREIKMNHTLIEDITGVAPVGFRAPGWDISESTLKLLDDMGYRYDSSVFPSYFSLMAQAYFRLVNSNSKNNTVFGDWKYMYAKRNPHQIRENLIEIPISVTPILRLPYFSTLHIMAGSSFFNNFTSRGLKGGFVNYELHSVDLLNPSDVQGTIYTRVKHACLTTQLEDKMKVYEQIFSRIKRNRKNLLLKEVVV